MAVPSEPAKSIAAASEGGTTDSGAGSAPPVIVGVEARGEIPSPAPAPPPADLASSSRNPQAAQQNIHGALGLLESQGIGGAAELKDRMSTSERSGGAASSMATEDMATEAKRQVAAAAVAVRQAAVEVVRAVGAHPAETLNRAVAELDAMNQAINSAGPDILPDVETGAAGTASQASTSTRGTGSHNTDSRDTRSQAVQDYVQARARDMAASRVSAALAGAPGAVESLCNSAAVDATQAIIAAHTAAAGGNSDAASSAHQTSDGAASRGSRGRDGAELPRRLTGTSDLQARLASSATGAESLVIGGGSVGGDGPSVSTAMTPRHMGSGGKTENSTAGGSAAESGTGGNPSTHASGSRRATDGSIGKAANANRQDGPVTRSRSRSRGASSNEADEDEDEDGRSSGRSSRGSSRRSGRGSHRSRSSRRGSVKSDSSTGTGGPSGKGSSKRSRGGSRSRSRRGSASQPGHSTRWNDHGMQLDASIPDDSSRSSAPDSHQMDPAAAQSAAVAAGQAALAAARAISHATAAIRRMEEDAVAARKDTELMNKALGALAAQNDTLKLQAQALAPHLLKRKSGSSSRGSGRGRHGSSSSSRGGKKHGGSGRSSSSSKHHRVGSKRPRHEADQQVPPPIASGDSGGRNAKAPRTGDSSQALAGSSRADQAATAVTGTVPGSSYPAGTPTVSTPALLSPMHSSNGIEAPAAGHGPLPQSSMPMAAGTIPVNVGPI